jgi:hypothetical protein
MESRKTFDKDAKVDNDLFLSDASTEKDFASILIISDSDEEISCSVVEDKYWQPQPLFSANSLSQLLLLQLLCESVSKSSQ